MENFLLINRNFSAWKIAKLRNPCRKGSYFQGSAISVYITENHTLTKMSNSSLRPTETHNLSLDWVYIIPNMRVYNIQCKCYWKHVQWQRSRWKDISQGQSAPFISQDDLKWFRFSYKGENVWRKKFYDFKFLPVWGGYWWNKIYITLVQKYLHNKSL